jgi:site-specific DNA-methyltransferase (adenine-specific)
VDPRRRGGGAAAVRPYYEGGGVTLYRGDALAVLQALPDASVDAVITDPPYSSGGAFRGDRMGTTAHKYAFFVDEVVNARPVFSGDNRDQRAFGYWCALWLGECRRVAKPGAPLVVFTDWRQLPTVTDVVQAGGWIWRGVAVWDKTPGIRPSKGRFRQQAEFLVWGSNGPMPVERGVGFLHGVFCFAPLHGKLHLAGKPLPLMRAITEICPPGGTVLDPFAGSGTTLQAAADTGRRAIGIEIEEGHCAVSASRLGQPALALVREASGRGWR